jgi:hypothetical protein
MKNKIIAVTTLSLITLLSFANNNNFTNANALLASPSDYDLSYRYESVYGAWGFRDGAGAYLSEATPTFVRSGDTGTGNFQYNGSLNFMGSSTFTAWPRDLQTLVQYRVSNTAWGVLSGADYVPTSVSVGSSINLNIAKITYQFNNLSDNNYRIYFDSSNLTSSRVMSVSYNGVVWQSGNNAFVTFQSYFIPAGQNVQIQYSPVNSVVNLDAIYLKDLGPATTSGYEDGYDLGVADGFEMGYETGVNYGERIGFEDGYYQGATDEGNNLIGATEIFRRTFTGIRPIFEIAIFPGVTLGTLALFPLLGIVMLFFKKVIQ